MSETPAKKPKATKAVIAQRIEEVLRIRLDGAEFFDVRVYAREKEAESGSVWELNGDKPLSDATLWRYIARSDEMIAATCAAHRKKQLRRHLAQRRNLYAKAVSQADVRAALACLDSEAKLLHLADPPPAPALPAEQPPLDAPGAAKAIAEALAQLRAGQLDPRTAAAVGSLAQALLRALETVNLERRVAELENASALRKRTKT